MEAILKFNLPEDNQEFTLATNGLNFWSVLWGLDQHLRSLTKYASDDTPESTVNALQEVRDKLYELMNENNVDFGMVE